MSVFNRRGAVLTMLGAGAALAAPASAITHLRLPSGTMRLTRRLEREMRGDAQLVVTREWAVQFARQGAGIAVSGEQISAKVDAPEAVAAIARIEEQRSTDSMFPILLSDAGAIAATGSYVTQDDELRALQEAQNLIQERRISATSKAEMMRALSVLQSSFSTLLDQLPADLFFPIGEPVRRVQTVTLPDGVTGEFELTYETHRADDQAWMKDAERQVITRIGDSERHTREVWTMRPE